jgi:hypothetical protein
MDKLTLPRADICPDWCDEHYTGQCGTRNYVGPADRTIFGQTTNGAPLSMTVWPEVRISPTGHVSAVAILDVAVDSDRGYRCQQAEIEMNRDTVRDLVAHLLDVAAQLDAVLQG